jgi:eukaryotic-like serine/threonine-protein kinase
MADSKKFQMNVNLLKHFDAAVNDDAASLKDSDRYKELTQLSEKYSAGEFLNEGGMKKILLCHDFFTDRDVAMAVPKDELDAEGIDRFIEEARITASLEHPNIVPVHELSIDEGRPFFTMKILGGENLGSVIKKMNQAEYQQRYHQQYMLEIFLKVCDAIGFAHSKGILHLDIKPSNIQINEYGEVLICDWGLAKYLDQKSDKSNKVIGTPGYMAPELIEGGDLSEKADIYSLGSLLYTILVHKLPFGGSESETIKQNVLAGAVIEPEGLPASLKAVILKALGNKPELRYSDCEYMAEDIRAYLNGFATTAERAGFVTLFLLMIKRYKVLFITILSSLILLAIVTTSFITDLNHEKKSAFAAKEDAELARDLAEAAEKDSMAVRQSASPNFVKYARKQYKERDYEKAYRLTKKARELDPENKSAKKFMINQLIGQHEFSEALSLISLFPEQEEFKERKDFINFCLGLKKKGSLLLQDELFPAIKKMKNMYGAPGVRLHFLHSSTIGYSFEERLEFIQKYLRSTTHGNFTFEMTAVGESYKLSLAKNIGMYNINVLHNLPIIELDLAETSVFDLRPLSKMKLRKLDLSGTDVLDLEPLASCPLVELNLFNTNVKHVNKLNKLTLEVLTLNNRWSDLSELDNFKSLRVLNIPKNIFNSTVIKSLSEKYEVHLY